MRLLKFFTIFAVTALAIFALIFGLNWKSFQIFMENRDAMAEGSEWVEKTYSLQGLTEFIEENPQYVSVASIVVDSPDSTILIAENTPHVMGTASNILILLAYAMEIENGTIRAGQRIEWSDVSRYQLPDVDEAVHTNAGNIARDRGWLADGSITLQNALSLLAQYNDLALSDYLLTNLRDDIWADVRTRFELEHSDMPLPFSGLYLAIAPSIQGISAEEIIEKWQNRPETDFRRHVISLSSLFTENEDDRQEFMETLTDERLGNTFIEERNSINLFPKTTAAEMAQLLYRIITESRQGNPVSLRVKTWLNWPLEQQREIRRDFTDYGALFDNRLGVLNGIDFGTSTYTDDTTVQAVFFDNLPVAFWFHMSSNYMHQDFQQRMIFDPAMIDRMKEVALIVSTAETDTTGTL
ncbi:hypothetical protein [Rhodohalobacter mucosus]|uniref:Beta-lactamase family protein n=1 Tax=Rhodohalobacter mucosus TaxID=2079485 RepID=A0A316TXD2_9BACT|nr:hypothetical protein [Rhodohalobacter mucosus]PWN07264.1 hypothetical protein DDZ15_05540 [Rhodohalobacter mucosus]